MTATASPSSTHADFRKITARIRTRAQARRALVEAVIVVVLGVGAGLLAWGGTFATNMVHDQLADQRITFPEKGSPGFDAKEFPGLQQYAGQAVDNGPKAKAYANEYIKVHLAATNNGKTYAETSAESRANPNDAVLAAKVQTLFRGETLRGILLYAWGWSVVGSIALMASYALFAAAAVVLAALVYALVRPEHS
jgi:hypothetical protein